MNDYMTFSAFFGVKRIHNLFLQNYIDLDVLDFTFSIFVMILLVASFLQVILRLGERALRHLASAQMLTDLITDWDDLKIMRNIDANEADRIIERLNDRYKAITKVLPENSDSKWRRAKWPLESVRDHA